MQRPRSASRQDDHSQILGWAPGSAAQEALGSNQGACLNYLSPPLSLIGMLLSSWRKDNTLEDYQNNTVPHGF